MEDEKSYIVLLIRVFLKWMSQIWETWTTKLEKHGEGIRDHLLCWWSLNHGLGQRT